MYILHNPIETVEIQAKEGETKEIIKSFHKDVYPGEQQVPFLLAVTHQTTVIYDTPGIRLQ
ncbi:unnamed protein product [Orchesella dallaii]|uniref:Uncharacterized protein n=1 Tax=Orchesella dallaii TaxID=48710 RepID=A0ABP1S2G5_9HEXA